MEDESRPCLGPVEERIAEFDKPLRLKCGKSLEKWRLAYETYGKLSEDGDNVVLVCHALSGSHHAAGTRADAPDDVGWWDNMIGPGKPVDTGKFHVVSCNNLGGCHGSTGPRTANPETDKPYGGSFPVVTVDDWVESQRRLLERLGIERLFAVVGGSLGGMQALRWGQLHTDRVANVVAIASTPRLTAENIAFNDIARQAIMRDPLYSDASARTPGDPLNGLAVARMLAHVTYISGDLMAKKFGRRRRVGDGPKYGFGVEYEVESYLRYQGEKFSRNFDPDTYLLMTRALDYFDLSAETGGDLDKALKGMASRVLLISFKSDWRFPPEMSRELLRSLLANRIDASYAELGTQHGHDSFLLQDPRYHAAVATFLASAWSRRHA